MAAFAHTAAARAVCFAPVGRAAFDGSVEWCWYSRRPYDLPESHELFADTHGAARCTSENTENLVCAVRRRASRAPARVRAWPSLVARPRRRRSFVLPNEWRRSVATNSSMSENIARARLDDAERRVRCGLAVAESSALPPPDLKVARALQPVLERSAEHQPARRKRLGVDVEFKGLSGLKMRTLYSCCSAGKRPTSCRRSGTCAGVARPEVMPVGRAACRPRRRRLLVDCKAHKVKRDGVVEGKLATTGDQLKARTRATPGSPAAACTSVSLAGSSE